jgi:hypothetical protein
LKKLLLVVLSAIGLVAGLMVPAHADTTSKNCEVFHHANMTQKVQVCVAINHSDGGYVNNVHVDFDDHLGDDVYYLRDLEIYEYWYSNDFTNHALVDWRIAGDFPIYTAETDVWLHHGCMSVGRKLLGTATFTIEWSPGVYSDPKAVSSDFDGNVICL